jgi:hypothetical protein
MAELKYIDPMSLAKVQAVIGLIMGLVVGILVATFGGLASLAPGGRLVAVAFGIASIIIFPIVYAVMGFIGGLIGAWIYNFVARRIGGIRVVLR